MVDRGTLRGYLLLATGIVACPCHIPLWFGLIAGTAAGAFLVANWAWVVPALLAYFAVSVYFGLKVVERGKQGRLATEEGVVARGP